MLKRTTALSLALMLVLSISALALTGADFTLKTNYETAVTIPSGSFKASADGGDAEPVEMIRIASLPDSKKGSLTVGESAAVVGRNITLSESEITLTPVEEFSGSITFTWVPLDADGVPGDTATATITVGERPDVPSERLKAGELNITTQMNWTTSNVLPLENADELDVTFEILDKPEHGTVTLTDAKKGVFRFKPEKDYTGDDIFTFRAVAGKEYSDTGTVNVTIGEQTTKPMAYADMKDHWGAWSAGSLAAYDFVVGEEVQGRNFFRPEDRMTRGEFVLYVCSVFDITPSTNTNNPFDDHIPEYMLPQINALRAAGVIDGTIVDGKMIFRHDATLTRVEAMKIIDLALRLPTTPRTARALNFVDIGTVPAWAMQSLENLVAYDIINGANGYIHPFEQLTRAQSAEMLWKAYKQLTLQNVPGTELSRGYLK
ncbi:S-layer homology domain-containing protein [Oscillospiraceae bacterium OttesenSCG-928-F05]|nr:S-layer homology domain-containing protein [Oscillospiraceae bacterium OttesenSCG-928-F05]